MKCGEPLFWQVAATAASVTKKATKAPKADIKQGQRGPKLQLVP